MDLPLRDRSLVVGLVVFAHVVLLSAWPTLPGVARHIHRELSVSFVLPEVPRTVEVEPEPQPAAKPEPMERQRIRPVPRVERPAAAAEQAEPPLPMADSAPPQPADAMPGLPDREPDYRAAYLNNPAPAYPIVARRMGWRGKVVLRVEVLANGLPGQVSLQQGSGHEALDNAALQAVRNWRFVAARQGGSPVARQVLVPITFDLKETE